MPSQEEYLDNLLKGIETENTETEVTKEPKMTGTEEETGQSTGNAGACGREWNSGRYERYG